MRPFNSALFLTINQPVTTTFIVLTKPHRAYETCSPPGEQATKRQKSRVSSDLHNEYTALERKEEYLRLLFTASWSFQRVNNESISHTTHRQEGKQDLFGKLRMSHIWTAVGHRAMRMLFPGSFMNYESTWWYLPPFLKVTYDFIHLLLIC